MQIFDPRRLLPLAFLAGFMALGQASPASADVPGAHPAYIHGLHDLRVAHRLLDQHAYPNVQRNEAAAERDVRRSYHFATIAAEADGKDLNAYEPIDANLRHRDRLVRALSALEAAHRDFSMYEGFGPARGWQHETITWVDRAIGHTKAALHDRHWDNYFVRENY